MILNNGIKHLRWIITMMVLLVFGGSLWLTTHANVMDTWWTNPSGNDISNTNTGKVGIGTTTPGSTLDVAGNLNVTNSGSTIYSQIGGTTAFTPITGSDNLAVLMPTSATGGGNKRNLTSNIEFQGTSNSALQFLGINAVAGTSASSTGNLTSTNKGGGLTNFYTVSHGGSGTVSLASSISALVGGAGTITDSSVFMALNPNVPTSTTWNTHSGLWVKGGAVTGTLTTRYGVRVDDLVGGTSRFGFYQAGSSDVNYFAGNVGIGTTAPTSKLSVSGDASVTGNVAVTGNITASGTINAKYQDMAEWVPSSQSLTGGTVVILDPERNNNVIASSRAYDTRVAGVVSNQPGLLLGEGGAGKASIATTGRVKVKVDATHSAIAIGDLLVTSGLSGYAMRSEPLKLSGVEIHRPGTLIGKALEAMPKGKKGEILVLLSLQ